MESRAERRLACRCDTSVHRRRRRAGEGRGPLWAAVATGAGVGLLSSLIGLGGAEFRLPLLIGLFGFAALQALIMNKAMSLIVVVTTLPVWWPSPLTP